MTEKYKSWVAADLCRRCGGEKPKNKSKCDVCRAKEGEYRRSRYKELLRENRCPTCGGEKDDKSKSKCKKCLKRNNRICKKYWQHLKVRVINHYGGKCSCCGELQMAFLSIDHVNGGGSTHRKNVGSGSTFYRWLERKDYPDGFSVLCMNCNFAKYSCGACPHQSTH